MTIEQLKGIAKERMDEQISSLSFGEITFLRSSWFFVCFKVCWFSY